MSVERSREVLAICTENQHKNFIRKALAAANYKVSFISSMMEATEAIVKLNPCALVQDWGTVDQGQARHFHLKFAKKEAGRGVIRIILVPELTPDIQIFTYDALIEKAMSYSNASVNLGQELAQIIYKQDSSEVTDVLRKIKSHQQTYSQNDIDNEISEAYKSFPHDTQIQLEYGALCLRSEDYELSAKTSKEVLHKEPQNVRAMNLLSRSLMKQGNFLHATQILEQANILSPKNPERLMLLGDAFYGKGDTAAALNCYQEAKEADSDMTLDVDRKAGQIYLEQGEVDSALQLFKESLSEDEAASIFNNVAVARVQENDMESALKLYETALKSLRTDKYRSQVYFNTALCYFRMGDMKAAERHVRRCLRADPEFSKGQALAKKIEAAQTEKGA